MSDLRASNVVNLGQVREQIAREQRRRYRQRRLGCALGLLFCIAFWMATCSAFNQPRLDEPSNYSVDPSVLRVSPGE